MKMIVDTFIYNMMFGLLFVVIKSDNPVISLCLGWTGFANHMRPSQKNGTKKAVNKQGITSWGNFLKYWKICKLIGLYRLAAPIKKNISFLGGRAHIKAIGSKPHQLISPNMNTLARKV